MPCQGRERCQRADGRGWEHRYHGGRGRPQLEDRLNDLIAYWRGKRSGDRLPARRDIDPVDIPDLLPHIGLIDVIGEGTDFRYRRDLVGSRELFRRKI
ncbi:PAS domain-containing protein [Nisaea sp.]|uniref:PAS domain-containing protein n=1 Tax=Nisaea sp. TaxID=2024842 RepID=UPI0032F03E12